MKKLLSRMLILVALGLVLISAACAEERAIDAVLEERAKQHGEKLNALLDCEEYLNMCVAPLYAGDDGEFLSLLSEIDFSDPRKTLVLIRPRDEIELLRDGEQSEELRALADEYAFSEICLAPLTIPRPEHSLYIRRVIEDLVLRDAALIPEIDGVAYVIQLYDDVNEEERPFLVTAFVASEPGNVLIHSEIVCAEKEDAGTEERFVNLLGLIDVCTGEIAPDDFIQRTYRERAEKP